MGFLNFWKKKEQVKTEIEENSNQLQPQQYSYNSEMSAGQYYPILNKKWDGEKTLGELGVVVRNIPDYLRLRLRAYDAYTKIDIIGIITSKYFKWVVGSGLKLQSEPDKIVLELEGIKSLPENFQRNIEARFYIFANSIYVDYSKQKNLHQLANDFFESSFIGGDTLCVCRFENVGLTIQLISGEFIKNPNFDSKYLQEIKERENYIENGIEFNKRGEYVAYFVNKKSEFDSEFERIEAKIEGTDITVAWLINGKKVSPDHKRCIPVISNILEKVNKLDRYTEASVTKAEQAANIVYAFEHQDFSTGENPINQIMNKKFGVADNSIDGYTLSDSLSNRLQEQTSGTSFNLPPGTKIASFSTDIETDYEKFSKAVFNGISASMEVPPEVALQMYNSNYSASRAAINAWGYIVDIARDNFSLQFYKPIYKLWFYHQVLTNKINAVGYVSAMQTGNYMITEAYTKSRWTGKNMPHIDPLKEVKAVELMLGLDLISREQATEDLGKGAWSENYQKIQEENKNIVVKPELKPIENGKSKVKVIK